MVQTEKVAKIRDAWEKAGRPGCDHATLDNEYYLGSQTGDVACLKCGGTWPAGQVPPAVSAENDQ